MLAEILQLVHEIDSLPEVLYKKVFWKASQNSEVNARSSHLEMFCQKVFLRISQTSQKNTFAGVSFW